MKDRPLSPQTVLNVNVPNVPKSKLNGFMVTKLGQRHPPKYAEARIDPRGKQIYWVGRPGTPQGRQIGTDFDAIGHNKVSISPLCLDMTGHQRMSEMEQWIVDGSIDQ